MYVDDYQNGLTDELKSKGAIRTEPVEVAFRSVPRHLFVPEVPLEEAYRDEVIPIGASDGALTSSASQPAIVAVMLEQLGLGPGQKVLEIGSGSGYSAALMAHMLGEEGKVFTVEIDKELAEKARKHLASSGFGNRVQVICADGGYGHPETAPYDRVIVTAGSWDLAPAWREQLRPGGRLVLPLELRAGAQVCVAFESVEDHLQSIAIANCGFVELRGDFARPRDTEDRPQSERVFRELPPGVLKNLLALGRKSTEELRIRAYPREGGYEPSPDEAVIDKKWSRLVLD